MHIGPGELAYVFLRLSVSLTKSKMTANVLVHSRACTASSIYFMSSLNEIPYPRRVLISSWCDSNNKKYIGPGEFVWYFVCPII